MWCSFGQLAEPSGQVVGEGVVRALTLEALVSVERVFPSRRIISVSDPPVSSLYFQTHRPRCWVGSPRSQRVALTIPSIVSFGGSQNSLENQAWPVRLWYAARIGKGHLTEGCVGWQRGARRIQVKDVDDGTECMMG